MRTGLRLASFAAALGLAAGAAAIAGASLDPLRDGDGAGHAGAHGHAAPGAVAAAPEAHGPAGLSVAEDGYRLDLRTGTLPRERASELAFRILGPDGRAVRDFDVEHERRMHLIVVRRDLSGFQHLHPRRDAAGRWSVPVTLPEAGVYRAYADFSTRGRSLTLAGELVVSGPFRPRALPAASAADETAGYRAELSAEGLAAGGDAELAYDVSRAGAPVAGLEPYLGADGHLVALREGDLAFLHVHPEESEGVAGRIRFGASFPSAGRYRLFMQFRHDGRVQTVAHTVAVPR